jgi:hypothetical protein
VTKRMAGGMLGDPGFPGRVVEGALHTSLVHMVLPEKFLTFLVARLPAW